MTNVKNYFTKQPQQISAVILTGILFLSPEIALLESATAAPKDIFLDATKSDSRRSSWVYRTDYEGQFSRLEAQKTAANLPKSVADAVLQDASQRSKLPISDLRIVKAERRQWADGCLEIRRPDILCTAVVVPGWLVTVEVGQQRLVYRTSDFGSGVVFDQAASKIR